MDVDRMFCPECGSLSYPDNRGWIKCPDYKCGYEGPLSGEDGRGSEFTDPMTGEVIDLAKTTKASYCLTKEKNKQRGGGWGQTTKVNKKQKGGWGGCSQSLPVMTGGGWGSPSGNIIVDISPKQTGGFKRFLKKHF